MVFQYDRQGNLVNEYHHDDVFGPTEARLRYVYDTAGEANFNSVYLGSELLMNQSSTFDQLGRVTQVSQSGGLVSSKRVAMGYDSAGRLTQVNRYESGTTSRYVGKTDYTYDAIGRLSSIDHVKANGVVAASYDYTYDEANRLTQLQSLIDGVTTYAYDAIGQVTNTNAVNTSLDESFTYDATGDRVTGTVVGPDNELVSDANYNYQYDDEGRRTRRTAKTNNSYEVYNWDHRGRLTEVQKFTASNQSQGRVAYKYDAFDRKIGRTEYSSTGSVVGQEAYIHQGDEVVAILDGNQKLRRAMLHGPEVDQVFAEETFTATGAQEEVYWGLADHQGTIRDVSTGYGGLVQVTSHSQYTTFGQSTHSTSPMRYTYTGRDTDAFTGLQYNRARWYDPATGRWISQDPIGFEAGDANLYRYVGNGPTIKIDPTGFREFVVTICYFFTSPVLNVTPAVEAEVTRILQQAFSTCADSRNTLTVRFHKVGSQFEYDKLPAGVGSKFSGGYGFDVKIRENPNLKNLGSGHVAQGSGFKAGIEPNKFANEVRKGVNADKGLAAVIVHELFFHGCYTDWTLQKPHLSASGYIDSGLPTIGGNLSPEAASLIIETMGAD